MNYKRGNSKITKKVATPKIAFKAIVNSKMLTPYAKGNR